MTKIRTRKYIRIRKGTKDILEYKTSEGDTIIVKYHHWSDLDFLKIKTGDIVVYENREVFSQHRFDGEFTTQHQFILQEALQISADDREPAIELNRRLETVLDMFF